MLEAGLGDAIADANGFNTITGALQDFWSGAMGDGRHKGKKSPECYDFDAVGSAPMKASNLQGEGKFKLSHAIKWIREPIHGKGLTIDPDDRSNVFEYASVGDGEHCSIKIGGKYLFAGDQATIKKGKDEVFVHESFAIKTFEVGKTTFCYIRCKRDQEHWYIDLEGMIRHRNRNNNGFMLDIFVVHFQ